MDQVTRNWGLTPILFLVPVMLQAQGIELRGRVVSDSGVPLRGAVVTLASLRYSVRADSLGQFRLSGTAGGTLELSFSAPGHRTQAMSVVLPRSGSLARDFALVPDGAPRPVETGRFLRGVVTDTAGEPVSFANVQINGGRRWISDDSGRVRIPLTMSGRLTVLVRRIGYQPDQVVVPADTDSGFTVRLKPTSTILPEMQVRGRAAFVSLDLRGFYQRMEESQRGAQVGYFVTPEELESRRPVNITDAVDQFPQIRVRPGNAEMARSVVNGQVVLTPVNQQRNMRIEDQSGCPLTVYLDGIRIQPSVRGTGGAAAGDLRDEQVNALISPGSTAGIEVYPRESLGPPAYPPFGRTCGVVLVWSK